MTCHERKRRNSDVGPSTAYQSASRVYEKEKALKALIQMMVESDDAGDPHATRTVRQSDF